MSRQTPVLRDLSDFDFGWLVGVIEGEGCFGVQTNHQRKRGKTYGPYITFQISMKDRDVVERVATMFDPPLRMHSPKTKRDERHSDMYSLNLLGSAARQLAHAVKDHLGERRRERVEECLAEEVLISRSAA
jgi:hypothetical protein